MVTKLKSITFIFENCDTITIDGKYVGEFLVDDIRTCIERIACNAIQKVETVNTFVIEIHKDANVERYQHNQTHIESFKQMTFDRFIEWNDITQIEFELEEQYTKDGQIPYVEHHSYFVDWTSGNDMKNDAQDIYISDEGNLYLIIAKDKFIEDFFDLEIINDKEYMDFHWEMYDMDTLED